MAADPNADIDLYAGVDELDPEIHQGESGGLDLYDDVLTTSTDLHPDSEALQYHQDEGTEVALEPSGAVPTTGYEYKSYTTVHPKSAAAQAMQSTFERPRGKPLYVGNLTWWTNDQTLTEALQECGVTDLINIKFFENRTNGQSKGFALIELGSEVSVRLVTDKLPQLDLNGQNPVVTPATKNHLHEFETQSRKNNPPGPGREGDYNRQEGGYGGPPGRGGYGYNRGGYRGRGGSGRGYGSRPGMGRDFEHGEHGPEMGRGGPWMGPGGPAGGPRLPPPGMMPYSEHLPPFPPGMPGMPTDKPIGAVPPQMMQYAQQPPPPGAPFPPEQRQDWTRGPVAPHVNPAFFPEGPPPDMFPGVAAGGPRMDFQSMYHQPRPGDSYSESLQTNQALASSAIKRAMSDANAGDYESGIETLVRAISLIKQSPVAQDEKSQVLVQSLQDFIQGLESQLLERSKSNRKDHDKDDYESERRHRKRRTRSRSRSRDRERKTRDRRSRSRSRDRERHRRSGACFSEK